MDRARMASLVMACFLGAILVSGAHNGPIVDGIEHMAASVLFVDDNQQDIGASSANRPRIGYFGTAVSIGTNAAQSGALRLPNNTAISARNAANDGDKGSLLYVDTSDRITIGSADATIVSLRSTNYIYVPDGDLRFQQSDAAIKFANDAGNIGTSASSERPGNIYAATRVGAPALEIYNDDEGNTARLIVQSSRDSVTLSGATTDSTTISIPSGAKPLGCSFNVDTAVVDDAGDDTWSAAFVTGSSTTLATGAAAAQDTKVDTLIVDEITTDTTQVRFTPNGGSFTSGLIEVVCYYETLTSLAGV